MRSGRAGRCKLTSNRATVVFLALAKGQKGGATFAELRVKSRLLPKPLPKAFSKNSFFEVISSLSAKKIPCPQLDPHLPVKGPRP